MKLNGLVIGMLLMAGCATVQEQVAAPKPGGSVVTATAWAKDADAFAAGRAAAESLRAKLGGVAPHVVVLAECFAEKMDKAKVSEGVASVFGKDRVVGLATYGFYTRDGVVDSDGVGLLALGGDGIAVRTAFVPKQNSTGLTEEKDGPKLKAALEGAGRKLAEQIPANEHSRLMIVLADTHSPKNQLLLDGIQSVTGTTLPITGGSANKNTGQNFIHWRGGLYPDAAVALMIDGNIALAQNGAQARDNDAVLSTARKVASDLKNAYFEKEGNVPALYLAFDCAGRKGKLDNLADALKATAEGIDSVPKVEDRRRFEVNFKRKADIFGLWCAGEIGSPEDSLQQPVGRGWHIMGTALGAGAK
jgi:hypothetical protein